ncbi:MAG TPA: RNA polymerase sigma factor [Patescibacteria group bacterium]|nr:RNA polymerase sigma factor [Patescibacteria group bacterium]
MQPHEDQLLIESAQQNPTAFSQLYYKYVDRIFQFIYYRVGNHTETAEELTQETFTRSLKNISTFTWQGFPYSTYLYSVARSVCQEHYKKPIVTDIDEIIVKDDLSVTADRRADIQLLWQEIAKLPKNVQEIFELRYLQDLSYDEIALIMKKKPGAIRTLVSRTLDKLQQQYAE